MIRIREMIDFHCVAAWRLWRRAVLDYHSFLTPDCAIWTGPPQPKTQSPPPPHSINKKPPSLIPSNPKYICLACINCNGNQKENYNSKLCYVIYLSVITLCQRLIFLLSAVHSTFHYEYTFFKAGLDSFYKTRTGAVWVLKGGLSCRGVLRPPKDTKEGT